MSDQDLVNLGMKESYLPYIRYWFINKLNLKNYTFVLRNPVTNQLRLQEADFDRKVCFQDVTSFSTAFLFFVETETTVGSYFSRKLTPRLVSPIGFKIDFLGGPYFWISCMIFRHYPEIYFKPIFKIKSHEKKLFDAKKFHFRMPIFMKQQVLN